MKISFPLLQIYFLCCRQRTLLDLYHLLAIQQVTLRVHASNARKREDEREVGQKTHINHQDADFIEDVHL